MAKYFFFDGEAAENFSSEKNHKAIAKAIEAMLGCAMAESAIKALGAVNRKLSNLIGKSKGESQESLQEQIQDAEESIQITEEKLADAELQVELHARNKDKYAEKLRDWKDSKRLHDEREAKKQEKKAIDDRISNARNDVSEWISFSGMALLGRKASEMALSILDDANLRGQIPSPYNEDLVNKLLEEQLCICGRELPEGEAPWQKVLSLLETASKKSTQNRMIKLRGHTKSVISEAKRAQKTLDKLNARLQEDIARRDDLEQRITELNSKLDDFKDDLVVQTEHARRKASDLEEKFRGKVGAYRERKRLFKIRYEKLINELNKRAREDEKIRKIATRKKLIESAINSLRTVLDQYQAGAREVVQNEVNKILAHVSHNHRICRFNEDFSLELVSSDGRACAKSSGESQLLSLVFMAALVQFSARRIGDQSLLLKPGAAAPLVLDSPFGQLDASYQQETAACLPKFAEQIVLFLSSTQGNEKVLEKLEPHIGQEYILVSHSKEQQGEKKTTSVKRRGETFPSKIYSSERDKTEVMRIG
jgi:DNA repair exonuclease SbcCD ATPase subunit